MISDAPWSIRLKISPSGTDVEASGKVHRFKLGDGSEAWIAGTIDAIRSRSGDWQVFDVATTIPLDPEDLERSSARLEGRFVLVVRKADQGFLIDFLFGGEHFF